jgi:hypothetical protein
MLNCVVFFIGCFIGMAVLRFDRMAGSQRPPLRISCSASVPGTPASARASYCCADGNDPLTVVVPAWPDRGR